MLLKNIEYDYAIELKPGTNPPYRLIYNLLEKELVVLRDHLKEVLRKGWI